MLDQLQSHGLLVVSCVVSVDGSPCLPGVDYAGGSLTRRPRDSAIFDAVGEGLGVALRKALRVGGVEASFAAPLDEALVEVRLAGERGDASADFDCDLAPYGDVPRGGRLWIGCYRTSLTPTFWRGVRRGLRLSKLTLVKRRGRNAHHVVESSFKAFARCLRASVDGETKPALLSAAASSLSLSTTVRRAARKARTTKETSVDVAAEVFQENGAASGPPLGVAVRTGVAPYDELLETMASAMGLGLEVDCRGDVHIDDHHTVEDVAIVLGQCLDEALGTRAGCARMGNAEAGEVSVVVDLSGRPHLEWHPGIELPDEWMDDDKTMAAEMVEHVFHSIATHAKLTLHVHPTTGLDAAFFRRAFRKPPPGGERQKTSRLVANDIAAAFGRALKAAVDIDQRRKGKVASSKGAL